MDDLEQLKEQYCHLLVKEKTLFGKNQGTEITKAEYQEEQNQLEDKKKIILGSYRKQKGDVFTHYFRGTEQNEEISHYDIDEALRKTFPRNKVEPCSEGEQFWCKCVEDYHLEVEKFLKKEFSTLDFSWEEENENDWTIPGLATWDQAEAYLKR